jgi:hypothetical protein
VAVAVIATRRRVVDDAIVAPDGVFTTLWCAPQ